MQWLVDLINSPHAGLVLMLAGFVVVLAIFLTKRGLLGIHTKYVSLGDGAREQAIIRNQIEDAYLFISSLEGKIMVDNSQYNGYFTKYVLEKVYDKVVEWIIYNHITDNEVYVQTKQDQLRSLVYSLNVRDEFKTPEFAARMDKWTLELIKKLIRVRKIYSNQNIC